MATVKRPTAAKQSSGRWLCRVMVGGQQIRVWGDTKRQAEDEALAVKLGLVDKRQRNAATLSEAIDHYIEARSALLSASTIRGYRQIQRNRFPALMGRRVDSIDRDAVRRAVNLDAKKVSPKTLQNGYGLIVSVLADAGVDVSGVRLPQRVRQEHVILQPEQLPELLQAVAGSKIELAVLMQLWLGLRRSEALALHWDDISGDRLTVRRAIVQDEAGHWVEQDRTKTAGSYRTLRIPQRILDMLDAADHATERVCPLNPHTYERALNRALDEAGLPRIGTHGLRHLNASIMLAAGVPQRAAMERGGWTSSRTMEQIYQHLFDKTRDSAADMVDAFFSTLI